MLKKKIDTNLLNKLIKKLRNQQIVKKNSNICNTHTRCPSRHSRTE